MVRILLCILLVGHISIIKDMDFGHLSFLDYGVLATGSALMLTMLLRWKSLPSWHDEA